jgi:hypothetical protein
VSNLHRPETSQRILRLLFPKIAERRFDNLYSVQTETSARGEQRRAGACTPFAAITDFQIEFSVAPQIPNSPSPFAFFLCEQRRFRGPLAEVAMS